MATAAQQNELWDMVCIINNYYEDVFRPLAAEYGLTVNQLRVLHVLHRFGTMSVGELAVTIGMARTNSSSLCKKLCKQGFLLRNRNDGGDERQVQLELTPEGNAAARRAESHFSECKQISRLEDLDLLIFGLRSIAGKLSPQGEQISRLSRWKAKLTPSENSRTSRAFRKAKTVFKRDKSKKENRNERREPKPQKAEKTLG